YITLIEKMLPRQGVTSYTCTGSGIGGNKVYDLYLRMDSDVIELSPAIVVLFIGINDVWHRLTKGTGTDADKFDKFYRAIVYRLQAAGIKVVLCTPPAIGEKTDFTNPQDEELDMICGIIRGIAKERDLLLVDLRKALLDYNAANNTQNLDRGILTTDGVHLTDKGNKLIAGEMWGVLKSLIQRQPNP
ncbi:MAG TPA: GDSL-type esterase/lipase family protein, partial [Chitinophagaceae bacterium]|nr:GDSL-type esterase/lipase family protein [Chitinophagaceae bacterium]